MAKCSLQVKHSGTEHVSQVS